MYTLRRTVIALLAIMLMLSFAPAAAGVPARQTEPVTFYDYNNEERTLTPADRDPQVRMYPGTYWAEALFLGLLDYDPLTSSPVPELALRWDVSADGTVWTFMLRDDVPWVRWDPAAGEATVLRMVTAHDAAYGIQRACDPRTESGQDYLITDLIVGCGDLAARNPASVSDADYDQVGVRALDDTTLEIHLSYTAGHFLSITPNPLLFPVPREVIAEHGDDWTEPGVFVTNGPFVLDQATEDMWVLLANPYFPADMRGPGNVERVVIRMLDNNTIPALYAADQLDRGSGDEPEAEADRHLGYEGVTYYVGMAMDIPPLDNVHVRRALSAVVNRDRFTYPMIHFTPPGFVGAPPISEPGVGYDPDYARAELALAGYPGCEGLPEMTILYWGNAGPLVDYIDAQFDAVLGCDGLLQSEGMTIDEVDWRIGMGAPPEFRPHMWATGWGPDYPDASGSLQILYCAGGWNESRRSCSEVDDLIEQAAAEHDIAVRGALYYDIEERLFGPTGEMPLIPLFVTLFTVSFKPWVSGPLDTDIGPYGGIHYDWYTIDQEAQLAARGE